MIQLNDFEAPRGCVHDVFAQRVMENPDAVAVICAGARLTYGELDRLANKLANRLIGMGVRPESRVAVCAKPSLAFLVAALGVFKAGGAYVPLDVNYPARRLSYVIGDSGAQVLITQAELVDRLPRHSAEVLALDGAWTALAGQPATEPDVGVGPDGLACVIYTSGSTGAPKGVLITHRGLVNLALAAAEEFGLAPGDRFLQLASVSFSAVLEEVYPALLRGSTLIMAGYRSALPTVPHFLEVLERESVNCFEITTAYWHQLVDELVLTGAPLPKSVRAVVMGGDRVLPDRVLAWRELGVPLIHVYGPTEATATGSYYHSAKEIPDPSGLLPIGRAIRNTELLVLDTELAPVPAGAIGELYIGGAPLARGYHGAPARTAERFVPHPFSAAGERLYRTGDQVRTLPDGTLEFLGRVDNQIKIRGFRVEPGEVEVTLQQHAHVNQALVLGVGDTPEDKRLVAYLTTTSAEAPTEATLRAYLCSRLPDYLVPARFIAVDEIPLTPHGKVDLNALSALATEPGERTAPAVVPRTGTEVELAAIWAEVLKLPAVGATDEFLALGGNSLQASRILARAQRRFGVRLLPNDLLGSPTVAALAAHIDRRRPAHSDVRAAELADRRDITLWKTKRERVEQALGRFTGQSTSPLSVSQQSLFVLSRLRPDLPLYNEAWQCTLFGELDVDALNRAIATITSRHETMRTRFDIIGGQPVQIVADVATIPVHYRQHSDRAETLRDRDAAIRVPIDPGSPPLIRFYLYRLAADEHLLVVNAHHLIFDGLSQEALVDELGIAYRTEVTGAPGAVPELELQYGEFALWQRDQLRGKGLDRLVDYWRARLAGAPAALDLPTDRSHPVTEEFAGARLVRPLPAALRDQVAALARRESATPYMVLLTVFYACLHRATGSADLCVGTPVANRTRSGIESLIGCFINTLVLRATVAADLTFRALLNQVRELCLGAYDHQGLPFDELVRLLRPERVPGRNPLFQVLFATEDESALRRDSAGLSIRDFESLCTGTAKSELDWTVVDRGHDLVLSVTYRTGLFDRSTVRRLTDEYVGLLEELLADPDGPVSGRRARETEPTVLDQLLSLWRETFADADVQPDDDFFELGGYSLLAVQLLAKVREWYRVEIPIAEFFEYSTVADVAERVRTATVSDTGPAVRASADISLEQILAEVEGLSDEEILTGLHAPGGDDGRSG